MATPPPSTLKSPINNWLCLVDTDPVPKHSLKLSNSDSRNSQPNPIPSHISAPKTSTAANRLGSTPTEQNTVPIQKQAKTFAQAVTNLCDIPSSQLPQPVLKGDQLSIAIPEDDYNEGMTDCKFNLHARVLWAKGSTPLTVHALKAKLSNMWKDLSQWGIQFIGKGFYELTFTRLEDVKRVRSISSWNLNPGIMKTFAWTRDFSPSLQNSSNAQVWLRIYGLAQEYWRPRILFAIASSVGTPICTDSASSKPMIERTFGQFARVLVDMDVSQTLRYQVLVERKDFAFFVDFEYENLPDFCNHCRKVGHSMNVCRFITKADAKNDVAETKKNERNRKMNWVKQGKTVVNPIIVEEIADADKNVSAIKAVVGAGDAGTSGNKETEEIRHKNQFEILGNEVENELRRNDMELEKEINEEFHSGEDSDSQETEYVEDTFVDGDDFEGRPEGEEVTSSSQQTSIRQQGIDEEARRVEMENRNREFLHQSWANMAEDVDAETRLRRDLEESPIQEDVDDDFQVVKSKGKMTKKKPATVSTYGTRKKAGIPKPFK